MKFLSDLFGRKRTGPTPAEPSVDNFSDVTGRNDPNIATDALLDKVNTSVGDKSPKTNIWDLDDDLPPVETLEEMRPAAPKKSPARARRTKTRLIGFENTDGVVDLFSETAASAPAPKAARTKFPVGWVVVVDGPGRGESFALITGMSQIGRGEDQAIQLDFGDSSVSRTNHAAIVYDAENHTFLLGHGGKSNVVRLNNTPVISNETIKDGDLIKIGETTLRFKPLCSEEFNWDDKKDGEEESEDVAIA